MNNAEYPDVVHYMDDFFFARKAGSGDCKLAMTYMDAACDDLGVPIVSEKTDGPTTKLVFFWITIDSAN